MAISPRSCPSLSIGDAGAATATQEEVRKAATIMGMAPVTVSLAMPAMKKKRGRRGSMIGWELVAAVDSTPISTLVLMEKYLIGDWEAASELSSSSVPVGEYPTSEEGDPVEKALRKKAREKKGVSMMVVVLYAVDEAVAATRISWTKVEVSDLYEK